VKPATNQTEHIDALLPQTQCQQCGYAGCRPYAEAIGAGTADINRCPPGGDDLIADLAGLLQRPLIPLDSSCGVTKAPAVAVIDEKWCIGCTLCIQACPVDAIAGAAKLMHTVIAQECTGCELCIPPCPVDCIQMVAVAQPEQNDARVSRASRITRAAHARARYRARNERLNATRGKITLNQSERAMPAGERRKHLAVEQAMARARSKIKK
jgi:Na+-translocating ferredoxin:NAD+ oxidoreductase subunit B